MADTASYPSLSSNEQGRIKGSIAAVWSLAIITVVLRFSSRRLSKAGFWYDDWLLLPAILSASALSYTSVTSHGLGKDLFIVSPNDIKFFQQGVFISELCWTFVIFTVKFSILAFYWRLFGHVRKARIAIRVLLALVTCWTIAVVPTTVLQCRPVGGYWDQTIQTTCMNGHWIFLGTQLLHVVTDVLILVMPIPLIWRLQMDRSQKVMLSGIFALAGFVTVISVIRLTYIVRIRFDTSDVTMILVDTMIWTSVEACIAIVCACLPSLRPILTFISEKFALLRKHKSQHKRGSELLKDMLPRSKQPEPILSFYRNGSRASSRSRTAPSLVYDRTVREMEAVERPMPEMESIDHQRTELEASTLEVGLGASRMRSPVELEAGFTATELQAEAR